MIIRAVGFHEELYFFLPFIQSPEGTYSTFWQRINKSCHFNRSGLQPAAFPHTGGSCHRTSPSTTHSGNFPSVRALRTDLSRRHAHAVPLSRAHSGIKGAHLAQYHANIAWDLRPRQRFTFPLKAALPQLLNEKCRKGSEFVAAADSAPSGGVRGSDLVGWETPRTRYTQLLMEECQAANTAP